MASVGNWTAEACSTIGAGDLILNGQGVNSVKFSDSVPSGEVWYSVVDGANREAGKGNFNGSDRIVRSNVSATLFNGTFNDVDPVPITLSGLAIVTCTFNAAAYRELLAHLTLVSNPHNTQASQIPYDPSIDPVTNFTTVQDAMQDHADSIEERVASASGIISGGFLTSLAPTQFTIGAGKGEIFDSYTNPENTSVIEVSWPAINNISLDFGAVLLGSTAIYINSVGNVLQISGQPTGINYRENIFLGAIFHINGAITEVLNSPAVIKQTATDVTDNLRRNINLSGAQITAVDALLRVYHREGQFYFPGINWYVDRSNPNFQKVVQEGDNLTGVPFYTMTQDGALSVGTTLDIPEDYNPSGNSLSSLNGNDSTIHRMYSVGTGELVGDRQFVLLYGQMNYPTTSEAKENLLIDDSQTTFPDAIDELVFLGYVCVRNNAGDFSDFNRAWISNVASGSSNSSGVSGDHTGLSNKDAIDQHPIESIGTLGGDQLPEVLDSKMRWLNTWQPISYVANDVVRDGDWTMVANKPTSERPAPQPNGEPQHVVTDAASDNFATDSNLSFITVTYTFTMIQSGWLQAIRIYVPFFDEETVTRVEITDDQSGVTTVIDDPLLVAGEWVTIHNINQISVIGNTGTITFTYRNGNSVNDIDGGWNSFLGTGDPSLSQFRVDDLANPTVMTIDHTDLDAAGRGAELDGVSVDSLIQLTETGDVARNIELKVTAIDTAPVDYTTYNVLVVSNGAKNIRSGRACTVKISIPIAQASEYVFLANHFPANPPWATVASEISFDGVPQAGTSTTAYGIDLVFQEASVSADWDFLALSSGGGGGGGGGDTKLGASTVRNQSLTADAMGLGAVAPPILVFEPAFSATIYTGDATNNRAIDLGLDLSAGRVLNWAKDRNAVNSNMLTATVSGDGTNRIHTSDTNNPIISSANIVKSYTASGVTVGTDGRINGNGAADIYVMWTWKATVENTGTTNAAKGFKCHHNIPAGFSINEYQGSGAVGHLVPHFLGVIPELILFKNNEGAVQDWIVTGSVLKAISTDGFLGLNLNTSIVTLLGMNDQDATNAILSADSRQNAGNIFHTMYSFVSIPGYSNIGTYTGSGAINNVVNIGFKPGFLLVKCVSNAGGWILVDSLRGADISLFPDTNGVEASGSDIVFGALDFILNSLGGDTNLIGETYIFMAIVESFIDSTKMIASYQVPESDPISFSAVNYTGNGLASNNVVADIDLSAGRALVWMKSRTGDHHGRMAISSRSNGLDTTIRPDAAQTIVDANLLLAHNNDGFEIGNVAEVNSPVIEYMAWIWRAVNEESGLTNKGRDYKTHYHADAGFSVISYIGSGNYPHLIPHKIGVAPQLVLTMYTAWLNTGQTTADLFGKDAYMRMNTDEVVNLFNDMNIQDDTFVNLQFNTGHNDVNKDYTMICFASIAGYSDLDYYTGTGAAQQIDVGFRPCFVMIKSMDVAGDWDMIDSVRGGDLTMKGNLFTDEVAGADVTFNSTGFTVNLSNNSVGDRFFYMAIVETTKTANIATGSLSPPTESNEILFADPTNLTFAAGFNADGQSDIPESVEGGLLTFGLGHENKYYYVFKDYKGAFGVTDLAPQIGNRVADITTGTSDYYLINSGRMYDPGGAIIERVYLGEIQLNDVGNVESIINYDIASQTATLETFGGVSMKNLPVVDPIASGALWNNAGVLNISAG